ncbi:MAG: diacylglycerol kinase family protein [Dysgonamonadaceae bacterium]|jgi:diacylglycerol kinase|nr:diacylglycerol kinase family protein [Dysgonamonadaceae bacterium]
MEKPSDLKKDQAFSIVKRLNSFKYAFNGLKILIKEEHNSRIHLFAAIIAIISGFIFHISEYEWIAVILCIAAVFALEIINSAVENIADFVSPEKHDKIKKIKDLSAAAVLIVAVASTITGLIIFLPKL